jgi:hypothetical protein
MENIFPHHEQILNVLCTEEASISTSFILAIHHIHHKKNILFEMKKSETQILTDRFPNEIFIKTFLYIKFLLFVCNVKLDINNIKEKKGKKIVKNIFYINIYPLANIHP